MPPLRRLARGPQTTPATVKTLFSASRIFARRSPSMASPSKAREAARHFCNCYEETRVTGLTLDRLPGFRGLALALDRGRVAATPERVD